MRGAHKNTKAAAFANKLKTEEVYHIGNEAATPMNDDAFMLQALNEARKALEKGEIPVGAVIVKNGEIIGRGHNSRLAEGSPFAHAEMAALSQASEKIGWRFDDCTIYVTLEPCAMCAGAIIQSRMKKLVYGTRDPKAGAAGSLYNITNDPRMYHKCETISGVMREECAEILRKFFRDRRNAKNKTKR